MTLKIIWTRSAIGNSSVLRKDIYLQLKSCLTIKLPSSAMSWPQLETQERNFQLGRKFAIHVFQSESDFSEIFTHSG